MTIIIDRLSRKFKKKKPAKNKSERSQILSVIDLLRPKSTGLPLIRIGGDGDGGYLVPDDLKGVDFCFSPGVADKADFEADLAEKYGIKCFLADASVDGPPFEAAYFDFQKKYLGSRENTEFMRLESWVKSKRAEIGESDLVLQMDIEGFEYEVLIDTSLECLEKFRMIVIEFHTLQMLTEKNAIKFIKPIFEKIRNSFVVAHIHPNNYKKPVVIDDIVIPRVLEVTFLRNDRVLPENQPSSVLLPHPLDQKNVPAQPDLLLPEYWWK